MSGEKLIIYDWNGTLLSDRDFMYEYGVKLVAEHFGFTCPSLEDWCLGNRRYMKFYQSLGLSTEVTVDEMDRVTTEILAHAPHQAQLYFGAHEVLRQALAQGHTLVMVSGWPHDELTRLMREHLVDGYFVETIGGTRNKRKTYRDLVSRRKPASVMAVGDGVDDMVAGLGVGAESFHIGEGWHPASAVREEVGGNPKLHYLPTIRELYGWL